jgi:hypothetical protein
MEARRVGSVLGDRGAEVRQESAHRAAVIAPR